MNKETGRLRINWKKYDPLCHKKNFRALVGGGKMLNFLRFAKQPLYKDGRFPASLSLFLSFLFNSIIGR